MLQKLRKLRTNENVLIAVDVLLHSKSAFMSVFLMAFMIRSSLKDSPASFLVYCIVRYATMGIMSIVLLRITKRHTLAAWRTSMVFSILQICGVILLDSSAVYFPFIVAICSAMESVLYWRPKMYFDVTEVSDDRRLRYKSIGQIFIEIAKVIMPIILGIAISSSSYTRTAVIILLISFFQLLLSILFRPTKAQKRVHVEHSLMDVMRFMLRHDSMHKIIYLSLLRGILISSAGYLMVTQIVFYQNTNSDLDIGFYTALASFIAIAILWLYRQAEGKYTLQKTIIFTLAPATILLPLALIIVPDNTILSIVLYVYVMTFISSFYDGALVLTRIQDILSRHLKDDSYRVEIESIAEVFLSIGRVVSISIVLSLVLFGQNQLMIPFAFLSSLAIFPVIYLTLPSKMWRHDKIKA